MANAMGADEATTYYQSLHANKRLAANIFDTEERLTGNYWLDGSPIYRKVVTFGALPNPAVSGYKDVAHGITGLSWVVSLSGVSSNGTAWLPLPYSVSGATQDLQMYMDATNIRITTTLNWSAYTTTYIVVEYTKTA